MLTAWGFSLEKILFCVNKLRKALDKTLHGEGSGLLEAVGRLPRTYRQVVYLRYYEGYGVSEIAEMLAVKPALVSTRLARARTKLKNMMGGGQNEGSISE